MNLNAFNRVLRTTLLMPVILLGILAGVLVWQIQEAIAAQTRVAHADEVIQRLYLLQAYVVDEETGLRGFQLTGDPQMLTPYRQGELRVDQQFDELHKLLTSDEQRLRLAQVRDSYALWQGYAAPALKLGRQETTPARIADDFQGKALMDAFRRQMRDIIHAEQQARDALVRAAKFRIHDFLRIVLAAGFAVGVLIGTFTSSRLRRVSRAYDETLQQLKTRADELFESRQSYLTTLESIGEGVIACDTANRVRFMNAVAQKLTGWKMEDALEQPLVEIFRAVHAGTRQPIAILAVPVPAEDAAAAAEGLTLLIARDQREMAIAKSAAPIRDASGKALGIVVVFRDITEARKQEQALIASEKTAVTGRLAASIAHEIHNPLDSVANLHFLLRTETNPAKRDEYLALAEQELARTLSISRAMLSLHRESRAPVAVVLPELIDSVLLLLDRKLRDARVQVVRQYGSSGHITAFPGEIRQVFTNILANAAEASIEPGGTITISIHPSTPKDGEPGTIIEVADQGPGVDPEISKKLFQPFVTTKGEKGTGLGLWVSLGIVQKHGGTMSISDRPAHEPRGAVVRVYLPATYDGQLASQPASHPASKPAEVPEPTPGQPGQHTSGPSHQNAPAESLQIGS